MMTRGHDRGRRPRPGGRREQPTMGQATIEFGRLLKGLREGRRVSQSKLAERADFDHS
jgi:hypothetical protein